MQAGRLHARCTLQKMSGPQRDSQGGVIERWEDVADVWADIQPLKGQEFIQAQQLEATMSHRIIMRYRPGVDPSQRLFYQGRTFNFVAVQHTGERYRQLVITALETVSGND